MGWQARLNPQTSKNARTQKLERLCRKLTREYIVEAIGKMSEADARITCETWNALHPDAVPVWPVMTVN